MNTDVNGVTSINLKLKNYEYAFGYITISKSSYLINIEIPELNARYITKKNIATGKTYLFRLDEKIYKDFKCGTSSDGIQKKTSKNLNNSFKASNIIVDPSSCSVTLPGEQETATINLLVVYTPAASTWAIDNGTDIDAVIASAISQANQVVTNNGVGVVFNLSHSEQVNYTEQSLGTDWGALLQINDGILDNVHELRKNYAGDLVIMLTSYPTSGNGGISTPLKSRFGAPAQAFSNVRVNYALYTDAFIHEIGHMMGVGHNKYQATDPGPTNWYDWPENTWSAGWRWQGSDGLYYSDIMTYQNSTEFTDGNPTTHIPYFSDPGVTHLGQAAGDPVEGDGARTVREMKHYVANYDESAQYCLFNPPNNYLDEFYIASVNIGGISNTSIGEGYADYTSLATCILPGEIQALTVDVGETQDYNPYLSVWIDWNDNKIFDSSELMYESENGGNQFLADITAPVGYPAGPKRMRIRTHYTSVGDPCNGDNYGEVEDYTIFLGEAAACTGPTVPQNFILTGAGSNYASFSWDPIEGVTSYELRYRKTGSTIWNNIPDIRYPFYTLNGLELLTEYEVQIRSICAGSPSDYTNSVIFSTTDYCSSSGTNASVSITRVAFSTIDNSSTGDDSGYTDFTSISTDLQQENLYNITIENTGPSGSGFPKSYRAWIDYNADGDFEDPGELAIDISSSNNVASADFTVPATTNLGPTRMRISMKMYSKPSPCEEFQYGEVEDYTVNILPNCETPLRYYVDSDGDTYGDSSDPGTLFCSDPGTGWSSTNDDCDDTDATINPETVWYADVDSDGYGDPAVSTTSCTQPSGYVLNNTDCDDTDATINPETVWYADTDGDGYGNPAVSTTSCTQPTGYVLDNTDCDDTDATINPETVWYADADSDGYGDPAVSTTSCTQPSGYVLDNTDCDDTDATINPDTVWYADVDSDGYGDPAVSTTSCTQPSGYVLDNTDCDDTDATINPETVWYADVDSDGYGDPAVSTTSCTQPRGYVLDNTDCDDTDATINPETVWYADVDSDGYGDPAVSITSCTQPSGYVLDNTDCDDTDATINPETVWYADVDSDGYGDPAVSTNSCTQPTGYVLNNTDCDDSNAAIHPGATEVCDGIDNDCDGLIDDEDPNLDLSTASTWYADSDGDGYGDPAVSTNSCTQPTGYVLNNTDCDDNNAAIHPGATEVCDGIDNDCDGLIDDEDPDLDLSTASTWYADNDSDGYGDLATSVQACSAPSGYVADNTDCDDNDATVNPGAKEVCDGVDNNCDGQIDEGVKTTYYADTDNDGYGDPGNTIEACSAPSGYVSDNTDCDDNDNTVYPGAPEICDGKDNNCNGQIDDGASPATWYVDTDGDGYGDPAVSTNSCTQPTGYVLNNTDCDDSNAAIHPGAIEVCDGVDNNCDGQVDEGVKTTYYADTDNDGYGDPGNTIEACSAPSGYVSDNTDCDDNDNTVYPGAPEICDGKDNNCNGQIDDGASPATWYVDTDGDGYGDPAVSTNSCTQPTGYVLNNTDCDDSNAAIHPGAIEVCDGVDNNCDGQVDEGVKTTYYADTDNDGYGDPGNTIEACSAPSGYVSDNTDCDDNDNTVYPGAPEICDGKDNDCNGQIDDGASPTTWYADTDGDGYGDPAVSTTSCTQPTGYVLNNTDCDDNNAAIHPGATEVCDGVDNNCDGQIDEGVKTTYYADTDNDGYGDPGNTIEACSAPSGYVSDNTDCDDNDNTVYPGAPEICDGKDNNCNGQIDDGASPATWYVDTDGDGYGDPAVSTNSCTQPTGYVLNNTDCDDSNAAIHPGATEVCDGIDNDCDGLIDDEDPNLDLSTASTWYADSDSDGYGDPATSVQACSAPSGYVGDNTDCDDNDNTVYPGAPEICDGKDNDCNSQIDDGASPATWYVDTDGDGYGDPAVSTNSCTQPTGYVLNNTDCDDSNAAIHPGAIEVCDGVDNNCDGQVDEGVKTTYYADTDNDSYGDPGNTIEACSAPSGYVLDNNDCDDTDATINPDTVWYADVDSDGYGDPAVSTTSCTQPSGYVLNNTDCVDNNATIHPGATEVCDGIDNDCDGLIDDEDPNLDLSTASTWYADIDSDGYGDAATSVQACSAPSGYVADNTDCNDSNSAINPSVTEILGNGIDDDCDPNTPDTVEGTDSDGDGIVDSLDNCPFTYNPLQENYDRDAEGDICDPDDDNDGIADEEDCDPFDENIGRATTIYYVDNDNDGFGAQSDSGETYCSDPGEGYSLLNTDCDDSDNSIYPGAFDVRGDGIDQNCDGIDEPLECIGNDILNISEVCSDVENMSRWLVNNPSSCSVEVNWQVKKYKGSAGRGSFIANPGDNYFYTPVHPKGITQVTISWKDSKGKEKKRTMVSTGCYSASLSLYSNSYRLTVYPNPLQPEGVWFNFSPREIDETFHIGAYDLYGRQLDETSIDVSKDGGEYYWPLDHSGWEEGIYLFVVKSSTQEYQIKVIK
ncbi:MopE-related protein [Christiangramia fulva]|nr:MopE-related protein [Christiangramia fulva]